MRPAREPSAPRYAQIAAELRARISRGELRPGDRLPSTREITREWGVAMATATKVLATLQREGWVRAVRGAGTVVGSGRPVPFDPRPATAREAPRVRRGRFEPLTGERLIRAAIEIADREGLEAVTMRRLGVELQVAAMALYRHVPSKDALLSQMAEAVFREEPLPPYRARGWRSQLETLARIQWALFKRHPWLAQVFSASFTRPFPAPNAMAHTEFALRALDGLSLQPELRLYVVLTVFGFVHGTAAKRVSEVEAEQESGLSNDQWMEQQGEALERVFSSGGYPMLSRLVADANGAIDVNLESLFELGLRCVLDGIAARLRRSAMVGP